MSFEELEREVRQDLMNERWRQIRPGVIALAVVLVATVTGYKGWEYYQSQQEVTAANNYFYAQQVLDKDNAQGIVALQEIIANQGNLGYQTLAQFRLASVYINEQKFDEARQVLLALSQQQGLRPYMKTIALLQAVLLPATASDDTQSLTMLSPMLAGDSPWRHLARMIEVELLLRTDNIAKARANIDVILQDEETPPNFRETMTNILAVL